MGWTGDQAACRCANRPVAGAKRALYELASRWRRLALTMLIVSLYGWQPGLSVASSTTLIDASARHASKLPLVVSLIAPRGVERTMEDWTPFLRDLSRVMEQPVELRVGKSQRDVVDDMLQRRADIAWLGNAPALEVVEAGAAEVFASMVRWDGGTGYRSVIVTHRDSPLKTLDELLDPQTPPQLRAGRPEVDVRLCGSQLLRVRPQQGDTGAPLRANGSRQSPRKRVTGGPARGGRRRLQ